MGASTGSGVTAGAAATVEPAGSAVRRGEVGAPSVLVAGSGGVGAGGAAAVRAGIAAGAGAAGGQGPAEVREADVAPSFGPALAQAPSPA